MFGTSSLIVLSAAILALTPLLWRLAGSAPAALLPLAFVVAWLLAAGRWAQTREMWAGAAAGAVLGLGLYSSVASAVMMPVYLALTVAIFARGRIASWRQSILCVAAFAVTAAPFAISWLSHPDQLRTVIKAHHLYDADRFSILQGLREMASWVGLTARSEVYWDYFNPAFLFLTGGVLLPPLLVLLPVGLFRMLRDKPAPLTQLLLAGFAVAPLAASLTAEAPVPGRILFLTPFAAVISARGLQYLLTLTKRVR